VIIRDEMDEPSAARAARTSFLARAEEFTPIVAVDAEGTRFLLSTSDDNVTPPLFVKRSRGEIRSLRRAMPALALLGLRKVGGTLIDVGANIGTTTISALLEHGFDAAVACEPEPRNLRLLELNLVANDIERKVTVCPVAAGDSDRDVEFLISEHESGLHEVRPAGRPAPGWPQDSYRSGSVEQVSLDTLAARGVFDPEDITLVWMDVQGHEGQVLRGGELLTERGVPLVIEVDPGALKRHGGLGHMKEILRRRYTHFVPLRRKPDQPFVVEPVSRLARVIERLLAQGRYTDLLLVRDPTFAPRPRVPVTITGSPPATPGRRRRRRRARAITPEERREFLAKQARPLTPLVAVEIDGATFIVRTSASAEERSLFTERSHPRLRRLDAVMAVLDGLGLGQRARSRSFFDLYAGTGPATVAALAWHGFSRAVSWEPDASLHRILLLNLTANRLRTRARALPVAPRRVGRRGAGLVWLEAGENPEGAVGEALLRGGPPVFLRLEASAAWLGRLAETHTHFVKISSGRRSVRPQLRPIGALESLADATDARRARADYVLAIRLTDA
jgi:FkbM family methyltransferase